MKKIILALLFCILTVHATCNEMYEQFKSGLDIQMTALCKTQVEGVLGYKFYIQDENSGYINAMLVFDENNYYLYFEGVDKNPFKCTENVIYRTEKPEAILKVVFAPRLHKCEAEFIEKYNRT